MTPRVGDVVSIDGGTERWLVTEQWHDEAVRLHCFDDFARYRWAPVEAVAFLYQPEPYYRSHDLLTDLYNREDTWRAVGADTPDDSYVEAYARNLRHLSAVALAFAERVEQESTDRRQDEVDRVAS